MSAKESATFIANKTKQFARKINHHVAKVRNSRSSPVDVLQSDHAETQFFQHIGFPESADSIAYEPVQKLLAVGTSDGRVKIIGQHGVEITLHADSTAPTKYLAFLKHRGAILRVTQDGNLQLYSVGGRRLLASVWIQDDHINDVAIVPGGPYIMLGCESGTCRIVLVTSRGTTASLYGEPAAGLTVQPYQILGEDLDASGGVIAVAVTRNDDRPLALIVHRNSGAIVWDVRAERAVCAAPDEEDDPSKPTCACWVGNRSNCFAVGYDDGSILVWGVPATALKASISKISASSDAVLVMSMRVTQDNTVRAAPVRSVTFMPAAPGTPGNEDCLLVCGGQPMDDPEMLTMMPLDMDSGIDQKQVPWFGVLKAYALMPQHQSTTVATTTSNSTTSQPSLMVLTEGGQLVIHDLQEWHPYPLTLPFQELSPITVSKYGVTLSAQQARRAMKGFEDVPSTLVQHALTLDALYAACKPQKASHYRHQDAVARSSPYATAPGSDAHDEAHQRHTGVLDDAGPGSWPFRGGHPALLSIDMMSSGCHSSSLLFTGHRDGRVRVWDAVAQVPSLLTTVPSAGAATREERLRAITALEVCPVSGILAVGHAGGDVRVYQFSDKPQAVRRATLDESLVPYDTLVPQPAGFQYILKYNAHATDITALSLPTQLAACCIGDSSGILSFLDLMNPQRMFVASPVPGCGIAQIAVGIMAVQQPQVVATSPGSSGGGGGSSSSPVPQSSDGLIEEMVLFVANEDSSLSTLSVHTGEATTHTLRPKNPSRPIDLALLDAQGVPVLPPMGPVVLPWADNNATALAKNVSMMKMMSNRSDSGRRRSSMASNTSSATVHGDTYYSGDIDNTPRSGRPSALDVKQLPSEDEDDPVVDLCSEPTLSKGGSSGTKLKLGSLFARRGRSVSPEKQHAPSPSQENVRRFSAEYNSSSGMNQHEATVALHNTDDDPITANEGMTPMLSRNYTIVDVDSIDTNASLWSDVAQSSSSALLEGISASERQESQGNKPGARQSKNQIVAGIHPAAQRAERVDYPFFADVLDASLVPSVSYALLVTTNYLRLYSAENVRSGDRFTNRKVRFDPGVVFASSFLSVRGAGVVSISMDGMLSVHSIPNLDLVLAAPLDSPEVLGFPWNIPEHPGAASASWCSSLDGQLMLTAPGNELVRFSVVKQCAIPACPASTFDWELAKAAKAAGTAASAYSPTASSIVSSPAFGASTPFMAPSVDGSVHNAAAAGDDDASMPSRTSFFKAVKGAASGLVGSAAAALQELERFTTGAPSSALPPRELPSLRELFDRPVHSLIIPEGQDIDDIDFMPEDDGDDGNPVYTNDTIHEHAGDASASTPGATAAAAVKGMAGKAKGVATAALSSASHQGAKLKSMMGGLRKAPEDLNHQERRSELLGSITPLPPSGMAGGSGNGSGYGGGKREMGRSNTPDWIQARRQNVGGTPKGGGKKGQQKVFSRTASEIKRVYGHTRAQDAKATMERNRKLLAERGQKLANLEEKSAAMQNDAEDFASLAQELEAAFANRKWWHF